MKLDYKLEIDLGLEKDLDVEVLCEEVREISLVNELNISIVL